MKSVLMPVGILFFLIICLFSRIIAQNLPTLTSNIFSGSGNCVICHGAGPINPNALIGPNGQDISPITLWRSTLMANAAKDLYWQAKVTTEVLAHPQLQQIIEDKCNTCHSPLGRTEAINNGQQYYSLLEMQNDPLALDGVSCTSCHQIKDIGLGSDSSFSGNYVIENDRLIYGPYDNQFEQPMVSAVNYLPVFGEYMVKSELCATCHTLFTPTIDNAGQIVGEIAEQTPYQEWKNSIYSHQNIQCQGCHVPTIDFPVIISTVPPMLTARTPFFNHYFVGGNVFMLKILKNHRTEIGVTATSIHLDSTIARTNRQLQENTAEISTNHYWKSLDTLKIKVAVTNKAGHKLPTSFPSRRMWLYLDVKNSSGDTVFQSGKWNKESGEIDNLDSTYERHYDVIRDLDQVQIYEAVMQDVDSMVTYTLLRGASYIKDNRIPPVGFTTQHSSYDTTAVYGFALLDPNFNPSAGAEGSGTDTVTYRIGGLNSNQTYHVQVKLLYQSISPRFVEDLFHYSTPEVLTFKNYYQQADKSPLTIDSTSFDVVSLGIKSPTANVAQLPMLFKVYPNPFNPTATIAVESIQTGKISVNIYDLLGKKIRTIPDVVLPAGQHYFEWNAISDHGQLVASGEYLVEVVYKELHSGQEFRTYQKIVFLK